MPTINRPKTFVVTLRADIRDAATIYALLHNHNLHPRNPSELATMALTLLADLAKAQKFQTFTSTADALAYLQDVGLLNSDLRHSRNYQTILKQLSLEDGTAEELQNTPPPMANPVPIISQEEEEDLQMKILRRRQEFAQTQDALANFPKEMLSDDE